MKILLALLSLALVLPAVARIGETPAQLATRYGKAWSTKDPEVKIFHKNGIFVTARIWNGTCHRIEFSVSLSDSPFELSEGQEAPPQPTLGGLSQNQISDLLRANRGGSEWKDRDPNSSSRDTADGALTAEVQGIRVAIITTEWIQHKVAEEKREEAAVTEGFRSAFNLTTAMNTSES